MRITTFLLLLAIVAYFVQGFNQPKCDHVYAAIEQPEIKIGQSTGWASLVYTAPPTGKHEGQELICVKCFHKTRQVLDYGQPLTQGLMFFPGTWPQIDTLSLTMFGLRDTVNVTELSIGDMFLKVDSIGWVK